MCCVETLEGFIVVCLLQKHIDEELGQLMESQENRERYLKKLYELYGK